MDGKNILHQKKVKLMGTTLIVLSILSALFMTTLVIYLASSYKKLGAEPTVREFIDAEIDFDFNVEFSDAEIKEETQRLAKQFKELDYEEIEQIVKESFEDTKDLLEGGDLVAALDLSDDPIKLKQILDTMVFSTILTFIVSFFLVIIGRSWRRLEPFSRSVILGLRGLGITFLAQLVLDVFFTDSVGTIAEVANSFPDYGFTMAPLLSLGILLLTLSWVIEHGQELNEAEKLTI